MNIYPEDAVGNFTVIGFTSMTDRRPDKNYSTQKAYSSIEFTSQAGYSKRRLRTRRPTRDYSLTYTNVNGLQKQAIENFYTARSGEFESFRLDLSHVGDEGSLIVRFDGSLSVRHVHSGESNVLNNFYTVSFKLVESFT